MRYSKNIILKELPEEYKAIPTSFIDEKIIPEPPTPESAPKSNNEDDSFSSLDLFAAAIEQQKQKEEKEKNKVKDNDLDNQCEVIQCELF